MARFSSLDLISLLLPEPGCLPSSFDPHLRGSKFVGGGFGGRLCWPFESGGGGLQ
jgi:hypothetical protein